MSDQEIELIIEQFKAAFGDRIPSPVHQPAIFDYYIKLFIYYYRNDLTWQ
jgi:hypothetical protein